MNLRPSAILVTFMSLAASFAVFASGCSWPTDSTSTPTAAISHVATGAPLGGTPTPTPTLSPTTSPPTSRVIPVAAVDLMPNALPTVIHTPTPIPTVTPQAEREGDVVVDYGYYSFGPCMKAINVTPWELRRRFIQWSPDGSNILFDWKDPVEHLDGKIYATDSRGSRIWVVLDLPFDPNHQYYRKLEALTSFDVSTDGLSIAYSTCKYRTEDRYGISSFEDEDDYDPYVDVRRLFEHEYDIATSSLDGTGTRRLTENGRTDNYPVWSPDGTRIAFLSSTRHEKHIYDGYIDYELVRGGAGFTRYGEEEQERPGAYDRLYTVAADGSDLIPIADIVIAPYPPVWSPDGRHIAFVVEEGHPDGDWRRYPPERWAIYVVESDGSNLRRLSDAISPPSWSPDGRRIAFARLHGVGAAILTISNNGSDPRVVIELAEEDIMKQDERQMRLDDLYLWVERVIWSPDGDRIAFTCRTVCVVDIEGSSVVQSPVQLPGWSIPAWSPDGSKIAVLFVGPWYSVHSAYGYPEGSVESGRYQERIQLYTMAPDGTDVQVLVRGDMSLVAENSGWRDVDASIDACDDGYVVPEPEKNPGLVVDCAVLVSIRDALVGTMPSYLPPDSDSLSIILNWHGGMPIDQWAGVTVSGSPARVTALDLPSRELFYSDYYEKRSLWYLLNFQYTLRGVLPPELGMLTNLRELNLYGNQFTGCVPIGLPDIWVHASRLERCPRSSNGKEAE